MDAQLLYRWSTAAQFVSVLMIAVFYARLARSLRRPEVGWWREAWIWNFLAMAVTAAFWFFTPSDAIAIPARAAYVATKIAYALLLVQGSWALSHGGAGWVPRRALWGMIAAVALVAVVFLSTIDRVGIVVQGVMGLLFVWCGLSLLRMRLAGSTWLAGGFILRGGFALVEAIGYGANTLTPGTLPPGPTHFIAVFLGAHSSVDLAGEWLLALGGVLAVTRRTQSELERLNSELMGAQEQLRRLADRDPLTGLVNRRALPDAFRAAFDTGAVMVFCDLNGFKQINDTYGHAAGDASLTRFADALRASFRPDDTVVRFAGDEFLVVCKGMELALAHDRVQRVRDRLAEPDGKPYKIEFSAGVIPLAPGEDAAGALRAADAAMYAAKESGAGRR